MDVKGLKDIAKHGTATNRGVPRNGAQAAFELALLEHEKAKLQRELAVWDANERQARERLNVAKERSAALRRYLESSEAVRAGSGKRKPKARARRSAPAWQSVSMEY